MTREIVAGGREGFSAYVDGAPDGLAGGGAAEDRTSWSGLRR